MSTITVEAEVDLDDYVEEFTDAQLVREVARRGIEGKILDELPRSPSQADRNEESRRLHAQMLQAMLRHDQEYALELFRTYLCDYYGRACI